jgi:hypothetical protein
MATHVQHEVGNPTSLIPTDRRIIRWTPVGAAVSRSMVAASLPDLHARQHHSEHLGFLESARMDREMARETPRSSQRTQKSTMSITAALMNMSNQRFFTLVAGAVLLVGGLIALRFPVFLPDFDQWGFQINCGSGFQSSSTQVGIADSAGTNFVDQCHTAIAMRRAWTIPLAVAGALLLSALLVRPPSTGQPAGVPVLPAGSEGAEAFDAAVTLASRAPDPRITQNLTQRSPASAA